MSSSDRITLSLSRDEAIVLFEWISRYNQSAPELEDQGEQRVLWDIEAALESVLDAPFAADYPSVLSGARARVRDGAADSGGHE